MSALTVAPGSARVDTEEFLATVNQLAALPGGPLWEDPDGEDYGDEDLLDLTVLSLEELLMIEVISVSRKAQTVSTSPAAVYVVMGGEIGIESELGQGSTFWFTVALRSTEPSSPLVSEDALAMRVLVAEPIGEADHALREQLGEWGLDYSIAADTPEIHNCLSQAHRSGRAFDLLLIDEGMLIEEGAEEIRSTAGQRADGVPIAICAVHAASSLVDPAAGETTPLPAGVWRLSRPARPSELAQLLESVLRREDPAVAHPSDSDQGSEQDAREAKPLSILMAEDNPVNQVVARHMLASGGYTADVVTDGHQAVEAVRNGDYDLVLMDCQMPELDGYEATRQIRLWESDRGVGEEDRVHIIALTANAMENDREKCLDAGMDDFLTKPIKTKLLLECIDELVESLGEARAADENGAGRQDSNAA